MTYIILLFSFVLCIVDSSPYIVREIPVQKIRIGEPYNYNIQSSTFNSSCGKYSMVINSSLPEWMNSSFSIDFSLSYQERNSKDGIIMDLYYENSLLYCASLEMGLMIFNATDLSNIYLISQVFTRNPANVLLVKEDLAYVGLTSEGISIFNISDSSHPQFITNLKPTSENWSPNDLYFDGDHLYASTHSAPTGAYVFQTKPSFQLLANWSCCKCIRIAVRSGIAYCGGEGLNTVNVTDFAHIECIGSTIVSTYTKQVVLDEERMEIAYLAGYNQEFMVINISDPFKPRQISSISEGLYRPVEMQIDYTQNLIYLADEINPSLAIFDISNKESPEIVGSLTTSGSVKNLYLDLSRNITFLSKYSAGFAVVDISNSSNPYEVTSLDTDPQETVDLFIKGDYLYTSHLGAGLRIYDISNRTRPRIITFSESFGTNGNDGRGIYVYGEYVFTVFHETGLAVFDVSNKLVPKIHFLKDFGDDEAHDVFVHESTKRAYVAVAAAGVRVFDLSDMNNIYEYPRFLNTTGDAYSVFVTTRRDTHEPETFKEIAFVSSYTDGLEIFDVTNISNSSPELLSTSNTPKYDLGTARHVKVFEDHAYVLETFKSSSRWGRVYIYDISNFYVPLLIGEFDEHDYDYFWRMDVILEGNIVVACVWDKGVRLIDVSNKTKPREIGQFLSTDAKCKGVSVTSDNVYVYTASLGYGISVYEISYEINLSTPRILDEEEDEDLCGVSEIIKVKAIDCSGEETVESFVVFIDCNMSQCFGVLENESLIVCSGHGECIENNICECNEKYYGTYCNITECNGILSNETEESSGEPICGGHGSCVDFATCECFDHYFIFIPPLSSEISVCNITTCGEFFSNDTNVCSSHGNCVSYEECNCEEGYYGEICQVTECDGIFSNDSKTCHGVEFARCTSLNNCTCLPNYSFGTYCNITKCGGVLSSHTDVCSNHGDCLSFEKCSCYRFWYGDNCSVSECYGVLANYTNSSCNGHGNCWSYNECLCDDVNEYFGLDCNFTYCNGTPSSEPENVCSGHGSCWPFEKCNCFSHSYGEDCGVFECFGVLSNTSSCSGHGECTDYNTCECDSQVYFGDNCNLTFCDGIQSNDTEIVCSGHGKCSDFDVCQCDDDYYTETIICNITSCGGNFTNETAAEMFCSGYGKCVAFNFCDCGVGYQVSETSNITCILKENNYNNPGNDENDDNDDGNDGVLETILYTLAGFVAIFIVIVLCCFFFVCLPILLIVVIVVLSCSGIGIGVFLGRRGRKDGDYYDDEMNEVDRKNMARLRIRKNLFRIRYDDIRILRVLGEGGSNAVVYHALWLEETDVAFKCFRIHSFLNQRKFNEFEREAEVLLSLSHPNILRCYGCTIELPRVGIVMEFCRNGDLRQYFTDHVDHTLDFKLTVLVGICRAMKYLHMKKIIHRDLKSDNVLLDSKLVPKVMDFGASKFYKVVDETKTGRIGTSQYIAPEVVKSIHYTNKCDIFSFSIMMWEIVLCNFKPYQGLESGCDFHVANDPTFRPELEGRSMPVWIKDLCKVCWSNDPDERPSFKEILKVFKTKFEEFDEEEDEEEGEDEYKDEEEDEEEDEDEDEDEEGEDEGEEVDEEEEEEREEESEKESEFSSEGESEKEVTDSYEEEEDGESIKSDESSMDQNISKNDTSESSD